MPIENILNRVGGAPSVLTRAENLRAKRLDNQAQRMNILAKQDETRRAVAEEQRQNRLREMSPRAFAGDASVYQEMAGVDPAFAANLQTKLQALKAAGREEDIARMDRAAAQRAAQLQALRQSPAVQQDPQKAGMLDQELMKLTAYGEARKTIEAGQSITTPQDVRATDQGGLVGRVPGAAGYQNLPLPEGVTIGQNDAAYKRALASATQTRAARSGATGKTDVNRWIDPQGRYLVERVQPTGSMSIVVEETGEPLEYLPQGSRRAYTESTEYTAQPGRTRAIYADVQKELKPYNEVGRTIDQLLVAATYDDPAVAAADVRKLKSKLANTDVRAMAELQLGANFGDIYDRVVSSIDEFLLGEPTPEKLQRVVEYAQDLRNRFVLPGQTKVRQGAYARLGGARLGEADVPSAVPGGSVEEYRAWQAQQQQPANIPDGADYTDILKAYEIEP